LKAEGEQGSVVVGAAEVIAALGADQLAVVARELVAAGGADLAVVFGWLRFGRSRLTM
jgi:hypothetical protein